MEAQKQTASGLKRSLKPRHLAMISIGGIIGQGLFLSSGINLAKAGPAGLLISYVIIGTLVLFVTLQLGEVSAYIPISGSFSVYARRFVHKSFGAAVGFNYFYCWAVINAVELTAIPLVMKFWTQAVPDWAWSIMFLVVMFLVHLMGAEGWGETEYWFSLIKILTVVVYVIVGCLTSGGVLGGEVYGFKYWKDPGAFSNGFLGILNALVLSALTMAGTEIVGCASGETKNPSKVIPTAVRNVFYRVLLIYILSVFVMGMVIPYNDPHNFLSGTKSASMSPFTLVFEKAGLTGGAHFVNAVILCTLFSCGNSAIYTATRTLVGLAEEGIAHRKLAHTTKRGVPIYALLCTCAVSLVCFFTSFIPGEVLFLVLSDLGGIAGLITWMSIAIVHYRFRRAFLAQGHQLSELPYIAPFFPYANYIAIVGCAVIILISGWSYFVPPSAEGLVGNYGGPIIFIGGMLVHKFWTKSKFIPLHEVDLVTDARVDWKQLDFQEDEQEGSKKKAFLQRLVSIFT
ncbi:lysine-specific permease [Hesseltinella vesiculosa]|uniref:Lysine-specific permease n=1 Tax=Hesseltinella vesiculosa TaxID=101127 RepID=A0A1X2G5A4_9FUNG|nr:lysine-specific permease [Hesseltinella vesiculosa]